MPGLGPQRGEINFRPRAGAPKVGVGTIAQTLERLCEPNRRQRAFGGANASRSGAPSATSTGGSARSACALTPVIGAFRQAAFRASAAALAATCTLKHAVRERRRQSAQSFDLLKEPPGLVAKRLGHRLERPGARGGVGDKSEVGFAQENELGVAGETPREAVRKAGGQSVRQNADAVGAAEAGRKRRRGAAHHIHVRIARRHHPPGALRLHTSRARLEAAGFLNARPGDAQRAEFRQCRQFVRVGGEAERDQRAGFGKRRSCLFKPTQ